MPQQTMVTMPKSEITPLQKKLYTYFSAVSKVFTLQQLHLPSLALLREGRNRRLTARDLTKFW